MDARLVSTLNIIQNSPEWIEWRSKGLGGSDIAAILGVCPWNTPNDVWRVKTKRSKGFEGNSFTIHGQQTEAKARARYELMSMEDMPPACAVHPKYDICRVSLDGLRADNKLILELKCPVSRKSLDVALAGSVPDNYVPQVQYQLAVTGADELDFFVYHDESSESALVKVYPNLEYQGKILAEALNFWEKYILTDTPPPLTDRDFKEIGPDDESDIGDLVELILTYQKTAPKKSLDEWKALAISLGGHPKIRCGRVQIATVNRNGKFCYHKLTIRDLHEEP